MRFRITRGLHSEGGKLYGPKGSGATDGDVIETDVDLAGRHGQQRFQPLYDDEPADELDGKTVQELMEYAEANEIDLGTAKTKRQIVSVLRAAALA